MLDLTNILETSDVNVFQNIIMVQKKPVGIMVPSVNLAYKNKVSIYINGPLGISEAKLFDKEDIWTALIASGSILFGNGEEPHVVQDLLNSDLSSRTVAYLSTISKNCATLINAYNKIQASRIAIIGSGGIGSIAAMTMAGAGVNEIILVDHDYIELSNLNRQLFYRKSDIGLYKVDVLKEQILERFPNANITTVKKTLTSDNINLILSDITSVLITADNPLGISQMIFDFCHTKYDALNCGYNNSEAAIYFKPKTSQESLVNEYPFQWERPPYSIMPSFGPTNVELAGIATSLILLNIAGLINSSKNIKSVCKTYKYPRFWDTKE